VSLGSTAAKPDAVSVQQQAGAAEKRLQAWHNIRLRQALMPWFFGRGSKRPSKFLMWDSGFHSISPPPQIFTVSRLMIAEFVRFN